MKFYDPHLEVLGSENAKKCTATWHSENEVLFKVFNCNQSVNIENTFDYIEVQAGLTTFDSIEHSGAITVSGDSISVKFGLLGLLDGAYALEIRYFDFENTSGAVLNNSDVFLICAGESILNNLVENMSTIVILQATDENDGVTLRNLVTDPNGYLLTTEGNHKPGHRNSGSASEDWLSVGYDNRGVLINGTLAVTLGGGAANDAFLINVHILQNLIGTLTIEGFNTKSSASEAAQDIVLSAPTAGLLEFNALNTAGALKVKLSDASDDNKVFVTYKVAQ